MLTDIAIKSLKPKEKPYKVADRDGLYVSVAPTGTRTFRYDYRVNGRRETLTIGRYGKYGITLAAAREKLIDAKKMVEEGISPAKAKKRAKAKVRAEGTFGELARRWLDGSEMSDSTRDMRRHIVDRDLIPALGNYTLREVTPEDIRALCEKIKKRGAPSTALHVREFIKLIYAFANLHGIRVENPAEEVDPRSIARVRPRDRSLSPLEIRILYRLLDEITANPTLKLGVKFILLTMKRKTEVAHAVWDEISFQDAVWTIPKKRMKTGLDHNVYLSRQTLDILVALKTCAGGSKYVFPSRYDTFRPISNATFNRITDSAHKLAEEMGLPLEPFTVHDLRRTGSTLLNELGFNRDWIEKSLAHEDRRSSRGVYNKAEYADQRRHMLQEWADMIDSWAAGETRKPVIIPESMGVYASGPDLSADLDM
ncbi:tyrosine-type recombinase/integrase [Henriciella aquimarina]|uniref:tyrosine-type recombinase/integrase n=1 Tax=Henriciella aquimarina TaxID=545261 RepID=UPI0009FD47E4|nr:integrase arm-type DNA-binding domain-containing protein [Henriciella aquimarina]